MSTDGFHAHERSKASSHRELGRTQVATNYPRRSAWTDPRSSPPHSASRSQRRYLCPFTSHFNSPYTTLFSAEPLVQKIRSESHHVSPPFRALQPRPQRNSPCFRGGTDDGLPHLGRGLASLQAPQNSWPHAEEVYPESAVAKGSLSLTESE